ncbi:hypothetical protein H6G81_13590 [Scytonema hofmannii FACHB-248]|uniref:Uncharacterized protein n=1 Tax=Scytonema hofmannii FACHB-248 TaxID=1842502 RepID=A0ABR8GQ33_9CYAN|nr:MULTISPECIES: hypothetical protein [Nostocales]MBD2605535.1 hypothetical protein [Scytonema hofmannii FACHB-248]
MRRYIIILAVLVLSLLVITPVAQAKSTTQQGTCFVKSQAPTDPCKDVRGLEATGRATGKDVHPTCTEAKGIANGNLVTLLTNQNKKACAAYIDCSKPCKTIN